MMIPYIISMIEDDSDREFMENLYTEYYPIMYKTAFSIVKNSDDSDDVIQNSLEKLISKISLLGSFASCILISYIVSTIKNSAIDLIRQKNRHSKHHVYEYEEDDEMIDEIPDDGDTPEEIFITKEKIAKLHMALDLLPERDRLILQFKYFLEMNDKEIALAFDISPDSVRGYLSRARKKAYEILEKEIDLYGIK